MPPRPRPWRTWETTSSATSSETTRPRRRPPAGRAVGQPRRRPWGELVEIAPEQCPNGHPFGPNRVLVGWSPGACPGTAGGRGGHRTYSCRACGATIYRPECLGEDRP